MTIGKDWIELRDRRGRYQGRYRPSTQTLILLERGIETLHELCRYQQQRQPQAPTQESVDSTRVSC